ncbi:hypothetical protein RvY_07188 [Ramazzottius varieornatus]|uniref:Tardigrade-unique protein with predicted mitochondria targeting peptide 4 n=1 Tax=Ramazzottius varieornatus TaxID=947166 RepID=A0A0E4AWI2_RAMVA|nr:tardigrade-unique protein with predicted mitochondria targeting peptide 4 [Ramazzottius varieornatus]GAU95592.1 hypothetical protein RvY_07188 [Ramazzottius varieornatus]
MAVRMSKTKTLREILSTGRQKTSCSNLLLSLVLGLALVDAVLGSSSLSLTCRLDDDFGASDIGSTGRQGVDSELATSGARTGLNSTSGSLGTLLSSWLTSLTTGAADSLLVSGLLGSLSGSQVISGGSIEEGQVSVETAVGVALVLRRVGAVNVVPGVADEGDLVEDRGVDAQVRSHVSVDVASVEDLALGVNVSIESNATVASKAGLGDPVVGWVVVGITRSQEDLHFPGSQGRFQQVPDELALEAVVVVATGLGSGEADESEENEALHGKAG